MIIPCALIAVTNAKALAMAMECLCRDILSVLLGMSAIPFMHTAGGVAFFKKKMVAAICTPLPYGNYNFLKCVWVIGGRNGR